MTNHAWQRQYIHKEKNRAMLDNGSTCNKEALEPIVKKKNRNEEVQDLTWKSNPLHMKYPITVSMNLCMPCEIR